MRFLIGICTLLISVYGTVVGAPTASAAQMTGARVQIGQKAPDFTLKTLEGDKVTLSDYFGKKVVLLEFWATWCNVCISEIPNLVKEYEKFKDRGFEILSITVQSGSARDIREVAEKNGITYPVLIDEDLDVAIKLYGLSGIIPFSIVVGADGVIRYTHIGDYSPDQDELSQIVEKLLKELPK